MTNLLISRIRLAALALVVVLPVQIANAQCVGDIAVDSRIDGGDLGVLLANWGVVTSTALSHACDLDGNAIVNGADLGILLNAWGPCPTVVPTWATVIEAQPDPAAVTDSVLRSAILATGLPWRVRDNGTGIEMLLVPSATFQMGCVLGSNQYPCRAEELPAHYVSLPNAFYLGRYEVTQAQWQSKMGGNPSWFQYGNSYPGPSDRPVEQVNWPAGQGFLGVTDLRLPTEAEWEYACRAGTQTPFYNGTTSDVTVGTIAWYLGNTWQTMSVGRLEPNAFGFHDMLGNVWEWVNDWYGSYSPSAQTNPTGPQTGSARVIRGGSFESDTGSTRTSARDAGTTGLTSKSVGFRVARNP